MIATVNPLPRLLKVAQRLARQKNVPCLLSVLLEEALLLCQSDNGLVWLYAESDGDAQLKCLRRSQRGRNSGLRPAEDWDIAVDSEPGRPQVQCLQQGQRVWLSLEDATLTAIDKSLAHSLSAAPQSWLLMPLANHEGRVIGIVQLSNPDQGNMGDGDILGKDVQDLLDTLLGYAGIALSNLSQVEEMKALLDAFVKVLAQAIDAKSPHTSAHCQRVPALTEMLARAACDDQQQFADFDLDEDGWYELHVAAWLHDCGKLATPDSVLDKSTKLHTLHDRIDEVASRFAVLRAEAEHQYEKDCLLVPGKERLFRRQLEEDIAVLREELSFLERVNRGGETMAAEDQQRIREIGARSWTDAWGQSKPLLSDDEMANLCIPRGTLTEDERAIINGHMDVTLDMLGSLPFPPKLKRVPEYAGGHHERMDGTGFPRGLTREQMSIPARIMAIADVFEALTAKERPYKTPLKLSEALEIMQRMRDNQHLDPDLYRLFVDSKVWRQYGERYLDPVQLDVDDGSAFL